MKLAKSLFALDCADAERDDTDFRVAADELVKGLASEICGEPRRSDCVYADAVRARDVPDINMLEAGRTEAPTADRVGGTAVDALLLRARLVVGSCNEFVAAGRLTVVESGGAL